MGTPAYMSPEQVSGRVLDHRTDIFSLGVLLYEMATGHRPFEGTSSAELVSSILRDSPPLVTEVRSDLPSDLARVIRRCLENDPRYRMQMARDISNEFRDLVRLATRSTPISTSTRRSVAVPDSGGARTDEGFWVAVLPFKYSGTNADLTALAEGLTDDIVTGLSRFSYLRVIARSSTARYASQSVDVRSAGKELSARYVMEGTLRQAGSKLRLAVRLVETVSGAHLWAENYERPFSPETVFELQDDLVPRIVSTVADWYGVLPHSMSEALRSKGVDQLSSYEAVLRSFGYYERVTAEEHAAARAGLERAVQQAPGNADGWAMLSMMYGEEHKFGFNPLPDPLGRSLQAARRAADIAPFNHFAQLALAQALFFRKEFDAFRGAAEQAMALNRMDGSTLEFVAHMIAFAGDWEHGCDVAERARQLNPRHPAWYWALPFYNAYRKGDYSGARTFVKYNMPRNVLNHTIVAALYGQLGEREAAGKAVRELLDLKPDFVQTGRNVLGKWYLPDLVEHPIDGVRSVDSDRLACAFSWPLAMAKGGYCSGTISDSRRG
ncbi:MAG: protein kinase domain-containing protein [Burkholderiales bacterium]